MSCRFFSRRFQTLLLAVGLLGCQQDPVEDACAPPADVSRPDGWTVETHCKGVDANYDVVFDDSVVHRLDIVISPRTTKPQWELRGYSEEAPVSLV